MSIEQLATITRLNKKFIEALDLDLKELYKIINGEIGDDEQNGRRLEFPEDKKKRFDYKLPIVLLIAAVIVGIIYVTIITREKIPPDTKPLVIIPAGTTMVRGEIKWSRPWERPAHYRMGPLKQNLILLTTDSVEAFVMSGGDTLFNGVLIDDQRKMFASEDEFTLSLSRNDCVTAIVNGQKDTLIGSSGGKLENYTIGKREN
jgi:hypothetical protein